MPETMDNKDLQPLQDQTVVVTRMRDQAGGLSTPLRAAGAEVIEAPTIAIGAMDDYAAVDQALGDISQYSWLVLTSANGVAWMFRRLEAMGKDCRWLASVKIAAVGSATERCLADHGARVDLIPGEAVGEALAQELIERGIKGKRVLLLRAQIARTDLPELLQEAGAISDDLPVYQTVCPERLPEHFLEQYDGGWIDWITLASPSSFVNLLKLLGADRVGRLKEIKLASIGPVSTKAIRAAGFEEKVEANPHNAQGLVQAIVAETSAR